MDVTAEVTWTSSTWARDRRRSPIPSISSSTSSIAWGRLVEDITTLTRLEDAGALQLERFATDELPLRQVAAKAEPLLDGRLSLELRDRGRGRETDRQRLQQALLGLLSNAAVHAGSQARVTLRSSGRPNGWRFDVADDRVGLGSIDRRCSSNPSCGPTSRARGSASPSSSGSPAPTGVAGRGGRDGSDVLDRDPR